VVRTIERWWNGSWGRLVRRDVFLREHRGRWQVETRQGGAEGRGRAWTFDDEQEARRWLARCLDDGRGGWRQVHLD
jgi:hypothetical protein